MFLQQQTPHCMDSLFFPLNTCKIKMLLTVDGMWKLLSARWLLGHGSHRQLHPATPQPQPRPQRPSQEGMWVLHIIRHHFDTFFRIKKLPVLNLTEKVSVAQGKKKQIPQGIAERSFMTRRVLQAPNGTDDNTVRKHMGAGVPGWEVVWQRSTHCGKVFENNQLSPLVLLMFSSHACTAGI